MTTTFNAHKEHDVSVTNRRCWKIPKIQAGRPSTLNFLEWGREFDDLSEFEVLIIFHFFPEEDRVCRLSLACPLFRLYLWNRIEYTERSDTASGTNQSAFRGRALSEDISYQDTASKWMHARYITSASSGTKKCASRWRVERRPYPCPWSKQTRSPEALYAM